MNWASMTLFTRKVEENMARMRGSWVSWRVVKILAPVPSQFMVHVTRESWPVALFLNVDIT